jgi:hypothetical protein
MHESDAPAPSGPEEPQVEIALGPDQTIYPEELVRPAPSAPPDAEAPESDEAVSSAAPDVPSGDAGPERGSRRRGADEAYQRGLLEGRQRYEQEQQNQAARAAIEQQQLEATQRVEQLFSAAESPDYGTRQQAWQQILNMYRGNRQAQALTTATRQQILQEMAVDFGTVKDLDGLDEQGYQALHQAPSAAELAKRAYDLGKKSRDEHVARLEAELAGLRGRLVGSRATPEAQNGGAADLSAPVSIEEYLAMSPKEAKKLSSAQIDALTAQLAAAAGRNGRSF